MPHTVQTGDKQVLLPAVPRPRVPLLIGRYGAPRVPDGLVVRERLLDLLRRGAHGPLTLVSAPAGTGKTVLLSSWISLGGAPGPVAWMRMDDCGQGVGGFLACLRDALGAAGLDLSDLVVSADADPGHRLVLGRLSERIAQRVGPVVLVLDADDRGVDEALGPEMDYLLLRCAGNLRLVLVTRADPPLPLHRYRLDRTITEIRSADLAFTAGEATELMQRSGLELTGAQVAALLERTGGWSAGLKFAAMSLAGRADIEHAIDEFTGDERNVSEYLVTEVLNSGSPELREVLLRTSIVDQLPPGLPEALTGRPPGQRVLAFVARGNSFIQQVSGSPGTYRYKSLFREFLRAQLVYEQPGQVLQLHRTAADWLATHGWRDDAIRHAAAAGAWAQAAGYLVDELGVAALLSGRSSARLAELFETMPEDEQCPAASIIRAALAISAGDADRCAVELGRAGSHLGGEPSGRAHSCRLLIAVLQARRAYLACDVVSGLAAVATAEHQIRTEPPHAEPAPREILALLAECKGKLLFCRGDFVPARVALAHAISAAEAPGCEDVLMTALGWSALLEALNGHLRRATGLADRADALAQDSGREVIRLSAAAAAARAWVRTEQYDVGAARDLARRATVAAVGRDQVTTAVLVLVRARLLRARGDLAGACTELRAGRIPEPGQSLPGWFDARLGAEEAAMLEALGRPGPAEDMIDRLEDAARPDITPIAVPDAGSLDSRVSALLAQATRAAETGHPTQARTALERSLQLAAPERLRRPFFEASPFVRERLLGGTELGARYPWLEPVARVTDHVGIQALTNKEREVLGHLAHLLGTEEIADTMFVSVNTVRTHVRSILRKLGVSRRNEAVRRAWELELIPAMDDYDNQLIDLR